MLIPAIFINYIYDTHFTYRIEKDEKQNASRPFLFMEILHPYIN